MTDINTLIAEMRAGLEGVTPGPWAYVPHFFADGEIRRRSVCYERSKYDWIDLVSDMNSEADSAHIARCHPDNIRALLDEIEYWRKDSAAAWDKCEEHRLEIERLRAAERSLRSPLSVDDQRLLMAALLRSSELQYVIEPEEPAND